MISIFGTIQKTLARATHILDRAPEPRRMRPTLTSREIDLFKRELQTATHYLESGCGGTTLLAIESGVGEIDIVETDADWIAELRQNPQVSDMERGKRLRFHHRDIGKVGEWGIPVSERLRHRWPFYSLGFWADVGKDVDFMLIDGRFRVATALCGLLMAKAGARFMFHDFTDRDFFHEILHYADSVEQVDHAVILSRKDEVSDRDLILAWQEYALDAR